MSMTAPTTDDPRVNSLMAEVRRAGGRVTTARRLIVGALLDATTHQTVDELATTVHAARPEVHLSTVYRTLDSLEAIGLVEHSHVGHGPALYHVGRTHPHLVCEKCGAVLDLDPAQLETVREELRERFGFELHVGHFALLGHCRHCASS
jgi:Fe2+ or Zn2+ uptake regulation protein